jgi:nucleotide-binding universal stress UspA family protein
VTLVPVDSGIPLLHPSPVQKQTQIMTTKPVLVGIDDSKPSLSALRMAADEAALRRTDLRAVHVWHFPSSWGVPLTWSHDSNPGQFVLERLTGEVNDLHAERAVEGKPAVHISVEVVEGETERELLAAAADSCLLVLGERHHHGPTEILGSVSQACLVHPPCPVLIVPMHHV